MRKSQPKSMKWLMIASGLVGFSALYFWSAGFALGLTIWLEYEPQIVRLVYAPTEWIAHRWE